MYSLRLLNIKKTRKTKGELISGWAFLKSDILFCLHIGGPITGGAGGGRLISGRAYKRQFTVFPFVIFNEIPDRFSICIIDCYETKFCISIIFVFSLFSNIKLLRSQHQFIHRKAIVH